MEPVQLRYPVPEGAGENAVRRRIRPKSASYVALRSAVYQLTSMADFKLEKIGSGFFADVYKVKHKNTGEVMVLKMNKNSKTSKAMLSEIQLMNRLSHPNILRFKGSCVHEGHLHALTEYINGGSLEELLLDKEVKLSWSVRLKIIRDIVSGMVYLHSKNVFHRDLNPKNCLIQREKDGKLRTVVADFGLAAKIKQRRRRSHTEAVGSPFWMAPELLKGKSYCEQADVFSFGITLAEIIARIPADPDIMPRTMRYGLDSNAFRQMCEDCPEQLLELLDKCCQVDPDDRPTFEEISEFLDTIQLPLEEGDGGGPQQLFPSSPGELLPVGPEDETSPAQAHQSRELRACISEPSILLSDAEDDTRSCGSEGESRLIVENPSLHRQRLLSSLGSSTGSSCGSIPEMGGEGGVVMGGVHHLEISSGLPDDDDDSIGGTTPRLPAQQEARLDGLVGGTTPRVALEFDDCSPSPKSKYLHRRTSMEGVVLGRGAGEGKKHSLLQKSNSLNVDDNVHACLHGNQAATAAASPFLHPLAASPNGLSSSVQTLLAEEGTLPPSSPSSPGGEVTEGAGLGGGDSGIDPGEVEVFKYPPDSVSPAPPPANHTPHTILSHDTGGDHTPICISPDLKPTYSAKSADWTSTPTLRGVACIDGPSHCAQTTPSSTANAHSPVHSRFSCSGTSSEDVTEFENYGFTRRCFSPTAHSWASSDFSFTPLPAPSTPWAPPSSPIPLPPHSPHSLPTSPTHFYHQQYLTPASGTNPSKKHHRQSLEVTSTVYPSSNTTIMSCLRKTNSGQRPHSCRNSALFPDVHEATDPHRNGSGSCFRRANSGDSTTEGKQRRLSVKSVHFEDTDEERLYNNIDANHHGDDAGYRHLLSMTKSSLTAASNRPRSRSSPQDLQRKTSTQIQHSVEEGGGEYGIRLDLDWLDATDPHSFKYYKIAQKSNMRLSNSAPDLSKLLARFPTPLL